MDSNQQVRVWLEGTDPTGRNLRDVTSPFELKPGPSEFEILSDSGLSRKVTAQTAELLDGSGNVAGYVQVLTDLSTAKALETALLSEIQRVTKLAGEDPLTGLANRRAFESALEQIGSVSNRAFGVIVIDLNDFKAINDSLGHAIGDDVLKAFANKLKLRVREGDIFARLGGDEFAILLPGVTFLTLTEAADRLRDELYVNLDVHGQSWRVLASLGYAHSGPDPASTFKRADKWMYHNKSIQESGGLSAIAIIEERIVRRS